MGAALVSTIYKNLNGVLKFYRPSNKFPIIFVGYVDHYFVALRQFYYLPRPSRTVNPRPQNRFIKRPFEISRNRFPSECNIISKFSSATAKRNAGQIYREREKFERGDRAHTHTHCRHVLFRGESVAPRVSSARK